MDYLCIDHDLVFKSEAEYRQHKADEHPASLPPDVKPEWLPDAEFVEQVKRIEQPQPINSNPVIKPNSNPVVDNSQPIIHNNLVSPVEKYPEEPVNLKYQWTGNHCGLPVATIEVNAGSKHFCIAICKVCSKQLESREVVDLQKKSVTIEQAEIAPIKKAPHTKIKYKIK